MAETFKRLCEINARWDSRKFNVLKGLRLLNEAVQGSNLLPGDVSLETLQSLAVAMYKNKQTFQSDVEALKIANCSQSNSMQLTQESLSFVAPAELSLNNTGSMFSNLVELKQPHAQAPLKSQPIFIETLTAIERMHNQLVLDHTVKVEGIVYRRTNCCKGRPGDGYVGCVLYQIDELIQGSLGVYLSKEEIDIFKQTGQMPADASFRVCILCYSQMLTCRAALFGAQGVGHSLHTEQTMYYQDLVNCNSGYASKYMMLPGNEGLFPPAPFLSFHPRLLRISMRGNNLYVDESLMWFRPDVPDFCRGVAC
jgi:hypothetical protein